MSTKTKKTYDEEFKKQAVQMLIRSGQPLAQIARELGIDTWALRDWKKRLQPALAAQPETLEAMRVEGDDFFCGLTFPIRDSYASLIVGGWGGSLVGISSIDGADASENETSRTMTFETGRWYRLRLRVSEQKIEAWLDQKKVVDVVTTNRRLSLRAGDIELSKPFGLAAWATSAAFRDIQIRAVTGPADSTK